MVQGDKVFIAGTCVGATRCNTGGQLERKEKDARRWRECVTNSGGTVLYGT